MRPLASVFLTSCLVLPALLRATASFTPPFGTDGYTGSVTALNGAYAFYWRVDGTARVIQCAVAAQTQGWVAVGFNAFPEMNGADIVLMSADETGALVVHDLHATGFTAPVADVSSDINVTGKGRGNGISWFMFDRALTTCDKTGDFQFGKVEGELTLLAAIGDTDSWSYHGTANREAIRLKLTEGQVSLPADVIQANVITPNALVPTQAGSYVCSIHELPHDREYHLVRFKVLSGTAALVSDGGGSVLHHVDMFSCSSAPGPTDSVVNCAVAMGSCGDMLLSGGYSGHGEDLPADTGFPVGPSNRYVMIQRHFYNAAAKAGIVDSGTGYQIWYTPTLRANSMGRMSILQGHLDIPARAEGFTSTGYCPRKCTQELFPSGGITVTSVNFHMHKSGRKVRLQVVRNGKEMPDIARLEPFSDAGASVNVDYKLLPGDTVKLHCTFDNPTDEVLKWGDERYDEMCVVNFLYYPKTDLASCADFAGGNTGIWSPSSGLQSMCSTYCQQGQSCGPGGVCEQINFNDAGCMKCACPLCDWPKPRVYCTKTAGDSINVFEDPLLCPNCLQDKTAPAEPHVTDDGCPQYNLSEIGSSGPHGSSTTAAGPGSGTEPEDGRPSGSSTTQGAGLTDDAPASGSFLAWLLPLFAAGIEA